MGNETMAENKGAKGKPTTPGRFAVSASKSGKGGSILSIERNGVRKDIKVRLYSPSLAYYSDKRRKGGD
jgi:hypothetical protein